MFENPGEGTALDFQAACLTRYDT